MADSNHVSSHRLYAAATNMLELSQSEVLHVEGCGFCGGILEFFQDSPKALGDPSQLQQHNNKAA